MQPRGPVVLDPRGDHLADLIEDVIPAAAGTNPGKITGETLVIDGRMSMRMV